MLQVGSGFETERYEAAEIDGAAGLTTCSIEFHVDYYVIGHLPFVTHALLKCMRDIGNDVSDETGQQ